MAATFKNPKVSWEASPDSDVRTLPELVEFSIVNNPSHLFCLQAEKKKREDQNSFVEVSFKRLEQALIQCQQWLRTHVPEVHCPVRDNDGTITKSAPVALLMESDLGLVVYFLTLMGMGIPVVLLSARLNPLAVRHLVDRTSAKTAIVSHRLRTIFSEAFSPHSNDIANGDNKHSSEDSSANLVGRGVSDTKMHIAAGYEDFLVGEVINGSVTCPDHFVSETDRQVVILHSSGTSGLPKPIYCSHRHFLGFSQCQDFKSSTEAEGLTISTSPFFHGFGMVPICLSLGIGKTICIPATSEIHTGTSVLDLIQDSGATALLTVPSILEEIASLPGERGIHALQNLDFVAFGGGSPNSSVGKKLDSAEVRLINHYGATETGPLTPFFVPSPKHDWHYMQLRKDIFDPLHVKLESVEQPDQPGQAYKLSMLPAGWKERFELQDLLIGKPGSSMPEFLIAGRTDDLICLATGEKVRPTILESSLSQQLGVKAATAFGDNQFELGVIVEPMDLDDAIAYDRREAFRASLWPVIQEAGRQMDAHAKISSPAAILILPPGALPRSDKGTILRREANRMFAKEIADVYHDIEASVFTPVELASPERSIRVIIRTNIEWRVAHPEWSNDDDFFELGMDSLQATKLRRLLAAFVKASKSNNESILKLGEVSEDIVYRNPSVNKLAKALTAPNPAANEPSESAILEQLIDEYSGRNLFPEQLATVVITGSTGSLGSFFLAHILRDASVSKVICLIRASQEDGLQKQKMAFKSRGIHVSDDQWSKVELHQSNLDAPKLGLDETQYKRIASKMTHIVHIAWPMSFKLLLPSFSASFRTMRNLIQLSSQAHSIRPRKKPRILFISSISTVGNYRAIVGERFVPENSIQNPECTLDLGYAKAKLVCEKIIESARSEHPELEIGFARVGQVAGAQGGFWNADEHFVALVSSSQKIGKFPNLRGTFAWLPVDAAAATISDIIFDCRPLKMAYHLENPIRQSWKEMIEVLTRELDIPRQSIVPFHEWLDVVTSFPEEGNPARKLIDFFRNEFCKMSCGEVILDTSVSRSVSSTMRKMGPVGDEEVRAYLQYWRSISVLK